jgi:hypothetical protein
MALVDNTTGGRIVMATGPQALVTVKAGTSVKPGDLIGYNAGFVPANHTGTITAKYVAVHAAGPGETLSVVKNAVIDLGAGSTATADGPVYLTTAAGQYSATDPGTGQVVGRSLDGRRIFVSL